MRKWYVALLACGIVLLGGCANAPTPAGNDQVLSLETIETSLQNRLPITRKASFGTVRIVGMLLQAGMDEKSMEIPVKFVLTSYEIPEGIEGLIVFGGGLRYDSAGHILYPDALTPLRMTFANPSLEEYISATARKGIADLVASTLRRMPLYTFPQSFSARKVGRFTIRKERLLIDFD